MISTNNPAPKTSPMSINLSLIKFLGVVIPHAALIPLRTAANAAEDVHTSPRKLAIPVIVLALTMPSIVVPISSLDTGRKAAISLASSALSAPGPTKKPIADITAKPSGNIEKSV